MVVYIYLRDKSLDTNCLTPEGSNIHRTLIFYKHRTPEESNKNETRNVLLKTIKKYGKKV